MRNYTVRRLKTEDAEEVAALVRKTLQITNAKDYTKENIDALVKLHTAEHILERAGWTHFYVVETVVSEIDGTGTKGSSLEKRSEELEDVSLRENMEKPKDILLEERDEKPDICTSIVGCGAIGPYWGKEDESSLFTIFVLPEYQGQGIGRKIIETLEQDEFFLRAKRVEIPASITACEFYRKMGYDYKNGIAVVDEEGLYRLEKFAVHGQM